MREKRSYGWVVAIAGAFLLLFGANLQYTFGVFVKPLINKFGWSRAAISGCVSARSITSGLISPMVGILTDRYGPRKIIPVGVFIVGLSYLLASRITSIWQLYLFLSVLTGIGVSTLLVPAIATAIRWFGSKSAMAIGIVMTGFSLAQMVVPPIATYLILRYSLEICFITLGVAAWVFGLGISYFIKSAPQVGPEKDTSKASEVLTEIENEYTISEALRSTSLWSMFAVNVVAAACYQMVVVHVVASAIDVGITPEAAAIILTLSGITSALGRVLFGALAGKFGNRLVVVLCLGIQVPALFFLAGAKDLQVFYIVALVYGLGYGGLMPIIPTLAGSFFGTKAIGSVFSLLNTSYQVGVATGPFLAGYIFDVTGSYYMAFLSATIAMGATFLLSLILKPPQRKPPAA